ncbi:MAG TPA: hypothetical protein VLT58_14960 [Polyangia bacterium]|nr:hypothetical protein [Polyangia bacterium]
MAGGASVQTLRSFLRDERAAAAGYRRALPLFVDQAETDELTACLASHERRIATLEGRIREMGADPEIEDQDEDGDGDGDGDELIGRLEEREDRALKHYLDDVCKLDVDTRRLIAREVLPEQVRTYDSLADMRLLHHD